MDWQAPDHAAVDCGDNGTKGSVLGVLVLLCGLAPVLAPTAASGATPPSGTIVYSYYPWDAPTTRSIRTVSFEGDDMNVLATGVGRRRSPTWSPDGSRIAYVAAGETDSIVLIANDGTDAEAVSLGNLRDVYDIDWSPGGRWIVFVARPLDDGRAGRLDLYSLDLIRRTVKRLTDDGASDSHTSWSPDGEWALFTSGGDITVISPDGTQRRNLNQKPRAEIAAWSPDGSTIAYVVWPADVHLMDADGKGPRRIAAFEDMRLDSLSWLPSGKSLLFAATSGGVRRLSRMDIDGSNYETILDSRDGYLGHPRAFGPDPAAEPPPLMPALWGSVRMGAEELGLVLTP